MEPAPASRTLPDRLFWPLALGGAAALWQGWAGLTGGLLLTLAVAAHHLDRPRRFRRAARRIAEAHAETLAIRRAQEIFVDAYGNTVADGWLRERTYFLERTLRPHLAERGYGDLAATQETELLRLIEAVARRDGAGTADDVPADGIAYERFCAALLEQAGWRARPTRSSGDQGADVIAERDGVRLVIQCKRLGKPAGNAAVQEAVAARSYWSAQEAGVVSASGYTPSARKLAAAAGVRLLHHDDLASLRPGRTEPVR